MMELQFASFEDLGEMARLHKIVYSPDHFTSCFSDKLLQLYYRYFFCDDTFVIKAINLKTGLLCGFVVCGSSIPEKISQFKRDNKLRIFNAAIKNPISAIKRIAQKVYFQIFEQVAEVTETQFLILSIVSDRSVKGIGKELVAFSKRIAQERKFSEIGLFVRVTNLKAINFYLRNNFHIKHYSEGQFYLEMPL